VTDPDRTRRLSAPFGWLFSPVVAVPALAGFAFVSWWVLFHKGLASATHEAFARPGLLLLVLAVTVLSAGFHEFGHAAAARRGGATPGVMGVGVYLVWPAFYTDVTDSYRLGRGGRLLTDLGGLYFNALVTIGIAGVWWATGYDALLLVVATQILQMLRQLLPLVRFDGYHVLADLTGVPDLFQRIGPTLRALVPGLGRDPSVQALKPWARAVITLWVLTVVPVLAFVLVLLVLTLPRVVGTALGAAHAQGATARQAAGAGDVVSMLAHGLSALVVLLPVAATAFMLARIGRRAATTVRARTEGHLGRRVLAGVAAGALVASLGWAWWPDEHRYRPVQAYEGGTLGDALRLTSSAGLAVGNEGRGTVVLPQGAEQPTPEHPQLAVVLVPTDGGADQAPAVSTDVAGQAGTGAGSDTQTGAGPTPSPLQDGDVVDAGEGTWIFPIDEPLAPDADDTQAVAVATEDGSTTYDVAFALVWADGDQPVQTDNEAYALASCTDCTAVAVAFQVVLVVGNAVSVSPSNIAVSLTYDCTSCLTFSLAVQLFVTLDGPLSAEAMAALESLWKKVLAYGEGIEDEPLDEIQDVLADFEAQILAIIEADQGPLTEPDPTAPPSGAVPSSSTSASSDGADPTDGASPTGADPSATTGTTASPAPSGSATPEPTPTSEGTPSPDPGSPTAEAGSPSASTEPSP
jgi:putative peptide zinc metalloprotease protein